LTTSSGTQRRDSDLLGYGSSPRIAGCVRSRGEVAALHERIQAEGSFVSHAPRFLIKARKPGP
jgi:hypothetical protein